MRLLAALLLQVSLLHFIKCQGGGGGGSPFGYDASSACSRPYTRHERSRDIEKDLPCDFSQQNWCSVAGNAYPWHAVRRFVQENQGLMRRMYGDERHINILRAELEKNDVEIEYNDGFDHFEQSRKFEYGTDYGFDEGILKDSFNAEYDSHIFTSSRSLNDGNSHKSNKYSKLGEHHVTKAQLQTTEKVPLASTTISTPTTAPKTVQSEKSTSSVPVTSTSTPTSASISTSTSTLPTTTTTTIKTKTTEMVTDKSKENSTKIPNDSSNFPSNISTSVVTLAQIAKIQNLSINEIPGQIDRLDENVEDLTEIPDTHEEYFEVEDDNDDDDGNEESTLDPGTSNTEKPVNEDLGKSATKEPEQILVSNSEQQQFRPRPEYRPYGSKPDLSAASSSSSFSVSSSPVSSSSSPNMEAQLFQDVAAKDQQEQPVLKLRGVNACPVKDEVVAPYWANNTRGELLALLNLYPFEQYIHWQKCTHENKQMYCRDGCRCEQQYRLHRLLAFDPNNDCRGIFSDWFKFPSCCVCRCYDLPVEFRVTSRSPRTQKRKIQIYPPRNSFSTSRP